MRRQSIYRYTYTKNAEKWLVFWIAPAASGHATHSVPYVWLLCIFKNINNTMIYAYTYCERSLWSPLNVVESEYVPRKASSLLSIYLPTHLLNICLHIVVIPGLVMFAFDFATRELLRRSYMYSTMYKHWYFMMTKIAKRMCYAFNTVYLLLAIKWIDSVRPQLASLAFLLTCV